MKKNKILNIADPPDGIGNQLINATIMGGLNFFTTLGALASQQAGLLTEANWVAAGIAAGLAFFTSLAIQRGLAHGETETPG